MAKLLLLSLFNFSCLFIYAQDTIAIVHRKVTNSRFVDFYPGRGYELAALSADGMVHKIYLKTLSINTLGKFRASAIGCDRWGHVWAADSLSYISKWEDTGWVFKKGVTARVWKFVFNKANDLFLLTDLGIYDDRDEMYYGTNKLFLNRRHNLYPATYFLDDDESIWAMYPTRNANSVICYSTRSRKYLPIKEVRMMGFKLKSFVYGGAINFLIRTDHYGMSELRAFDLKGSDSLYANKYDPIRGPTAKEEEYLSSGWFDKTMQDLYYYSSMGVFKAHYDSVKKQLLPRKQLFPAQHDWTNSEPDKTYFTMRVKSFYQYEDIIVYLHEEQGLFIYKNGILYNLH